MAGDATKRGHTEITVVTLTEVREIRYWCDRFEVRPKELKRAVKAVGNNAVDVERYIREYIRQAMKESATEGD